MHRSIEVMFGVHERSVGLHDVGPDGKVGDVFQTGPVGIGTGRGSTTVLNPAVRKGGGEGIDQSERGLSDETTVTC
jgi:hypothetical protein